MTYLLDTHCWLWLKTDASRLPSPLRRKLLRQPGALVLSSVCVMELAIKQSTGKLSLGAGGTRQFVAELIDDGVSTLDAGVEYAHIDGTSIYFRDPDGARLELISDPLGEMYGSPVM